MLFNQQVDMAHQDYPGKRSALTNMDLNKLVLQIWEKQVFYVQVFVWLWEKSVDKKTYVYMFYEYKSSKVTKQG